MEMSVRNPPCTLNPLFSENADPEAVQAPPPIPLSFAQQRLWFLEQLEPNTPVYNVNLALRLTGTLDREGLESAITEIVRRHEALRTNFIAVRGQPVQVVRAAERVLVRSVDFEHRVRAAEGDRGLTRFLKEEAQRPFDLTNELLIRAVLLRLQAREHVLLFTLHHIICDEWSLRVLLRELSLAYASRCAGESAALPGLPIQYADFALWQRDWLQGTELERQLTYWRNRLKGDVPLLHFPSDAGPAPIRSWRGAHLAMNLPAALSAALREFSRGEGVTLFMTLLAGFKALLWRYTDQSSITVGSPIAGRTRLETEGLIGFFVNTLLLRTDFAGDPTFRQAVQRVRETTLGAYDHQELPFEKLVQELHPERSASRIPLVRALFALEEQLVDGFALPGLNVEVVPMETETAKVDLTWVVHDTRPALKVSVEYATTVLQQPTAAGLVRHWFNLLERALAAPDQPLSTVPLLDASERRRMMVEWNQTSRPYPNSSLAELFEAQAQERPSAVAVRYGVSELTYTALNRRANLVAHRLRQVGVGPEVIVGLCVERSLEMIVGLLGIIKAGGAYLPLDPACPTERVGFMLRDADVPVLLTQESLRSTLPSTGAQIVALDPLDNGPDANPSPIATPDSLAYVIYTSGSTGQPKGVLVTQRGILRLVCNADYAPLTPQDRMAQLSNVAFDAATFEIWGALLNGATLVGFTRDVALAPVDLAACLLRERITTLFLTTALFNQMAADAPAAFGSLKYLLFGGEAVDPTSVRKVLQECPPEHLLHVYGPTETTTFASCHRVRDVPENATTVPIGTPIANTRIHLLDRHFEPVPIGVPGEIYIGGPGVARGYLHQPQLTAERFLPDPFTPEAGAKLYRTGDLGRYRPNGSIEFIGRLDQQVKIRGFRVEPGEIESLVDAHPAVKESAVVAQDGDPRCGKSLVAYIVFRSAVTGAVQDVRRYLRERLPEYMVPARFVPLSALPLNANGKVERRALPAPDYERPELPDDFRAPQTAVELQLANIWQDTLGLKMVGVDDNFFDLGGHSLLAVRLFAAIEEKFGQKLPLACLFERPTIRQLACRIDEAQPPASWPCVVDIQPYGAQPPFFWVHSLGGDGGGGFFYYRKLAQLLGPDQPSFGIRSPREPFTRIEPMAAYYVEELLKVQPEGPYFLGGFCFGGVVAFEMACALQAAGKEVGLLALLESMPPLRPRGGFRWNIRTAGALAGNLHYWMRDLAEQSPAELAGLIRRKAVSAREKLWRLMTSALSRTERPRLEDIIDMSQYPKDYIRYAEAHWQALLAYCPRHYPGRITLFRARKQRLLHVDPASGWGELADDVAINIIPGTHEKMLEEPNVHVLVSELKACLIEVQSQVGYPPLGPIVDADRVPTHPAFSSPCSIIT
jgi:amino acid adenylation domain-containing protein